jgi:hypothetical protein
VGHSGRADAGNAGAMLASTEVVEIQHDIECVEAV